MWHNESIVRGNARPCSTSLSIDFSRAAEFRADPSDLWFPLWSIASRSDFWLYPLLVIDGSATFFGLCQLFFLCLRGNEISVWFCWCPEILSYILVGFPFGIILLILSFHLLSLIFGCSFVQPPVSVWRRRLVFWDFDWFYYQYFDRCHYPFGVAILFSI